MYAVIDLEATGGKPSEERIIEVAIFLYDGKDIVDQFISLIINLKSCVNLWQVPFEAYIYHGSNNLSNFSWFAHNYKLSAPDIISISSLVIAACLLLL